MRKIRSHIDNTDNILTHKHPHPVIRLNRTPLRADDSLISSPEISYYCNLRISNSIDQRYQGVLKIISKNRHKHEQDHRFGYYLLFKPSMAQMKHSLHWIFYL